MAKKKTLTEAEQAVLGSIAEGNNNLGDFWAATVAHLKKSGYVFYGRIAGKCVVYLTPAGFKRVWSENL